MPIDGYAPDYDGRKDKIVSKQNGRRHIGLNPAECRVTHYRSDGKIKTQKKICDFILINEDKCTAYIIELKGERIDIAAEQLRDTEELLREKLKRYKLMYRVVVSGYDVHHVRHASTRKILDPLQKKTVLKIQVNELKENI